METGTETYAVQTPYSATESYSRGTGTTHRTCTRTVTRYRSDTKTRVATWPVKEVLGACAGRVELFARDHGEYLVELDYRDRKVCSVTCYEVIRSGESFEHRPCEGS